MAKLYFQTLTFRILFLGLLTALIISSVPACSNSSVDAGLDKDWMTFTTERFSVDYPAGWETGEYIEWFFFQDLEAINTGYYDFRSVETHKYLGFFHAENYLSELSENEKETLLKAYRDEGVVLSKDDNSFVRERDLTISGQKAYKYMFTTESHWGDNNTSIIVSYFQNDLYFIILEAKASGYEEVKPIFDYMLNSMEFR